MSASKPTNRFQSLWEPRIGAEAARTLRTSSMWDLLARPVSVMCAIGGGFCFAQLLWLAVILWVIVVLLWSEWIVLRRRLAAQISAYLNVQVSWSELPFFWTGRFDKWLAWKRAGGKRTRRWRLFGDRYRL